MFLLFLLIFCLFLLNFSLSTSLHWNQALCLNQQAYLISTNINFKTWKLLVCCIVEGKIDSFTDLCFNSRGRWRWIIWNCFSCQDHSQRNKCLMYVSENLLLMTYQWPQSHGGVQGQPVRCSQWSASFDWLTLGF